jgi:hypothetical protein
MTNLSSRMSNMDQEVDKMMQIEDQTMGALSKIAGNKRKDETYNKFNSKFLTKINVEV